MSTSEIYRACRDALRGVSPRPSVIRYMGEAAETPAGAYVAERFSVTQYDNRNIGAGGPMEQRGTYTITLHYPAVEGVVDTYAMHAAMDAILAAFAPGKMILSGDRPVSVFEVIPTGPATIDPGWLTTSIRVRWDRFPPAP